MPVRYPRVLIVTAPDPSRTVVYDFNDDTQTLAAGSKTDLTAADWSFGQLDLLGDPDAVGVEWALQRISFKQTITGTKAAAMARQVAMSRALLTTRFWVEFQLDATTAPVWWHGYRTPPGEVSIEQVYVPGNLPDRWEIAGGIDVDPFSYATRVVLTAKTVGNDPANDTTVPSSGYALPTIKGDSPSRLRVKVKPAGDAPGPTRWLVSCISSDRAAPIIRAPIGAAAGDGFSPFNGTSASATNTRAAGGRSRSLAFTDPTLQLRLQGNVLISAPYGRYLVLLRCSAVGTLAATVNFRLYTANVSTGGPTPLTALASQTWAIPPTSTPATYKLVPLGVLAFGDGVPTGVPGATAKPIGIYASASSTDVVLTFDDLILVPISGPGITSATTLMVGSTENTPGSAVPMHVDGDSEQTFMEDLFETSIVSNVGGFPTVDPAAAYNHLFVAPMSVASGEAETTAPTSVGQTTTVTVSYHPRNTYLGDGT